MTVESSASPLEPVLSLEERRRFYLTALGARVALATAFLLVMLVFGISEAMPRPNSAANVFILGCLALVNGAYWAIGIRREFPIADLAIHDAIDVVVLTLVIHYAGGI